MQSVLSAHKILSSVSTPLYHLPVVAVSKSAEILLISNALTRIEKKQGKKLQAKRPLKQKSQKRKTSKFDQFFEQVKKLQAKKPLKQKAQKRKTSKFDQFFCQQRQEHCFERVSTNEISIEFCVLILIFCHILRI